MHASFIHSLASKSIGALQPTDLLSDFILEFLKLLGQLLIVELRVGQQERGREPVYGLESEIDLGIKPGIVEGGFLANILLSFLTLGLCVQTIRSMLEFGHHMFLTLQIEQA